MKKLTMSSSEAISPLHSILPHPHHPAGHTRLHSHNHAHHHSYSDTPDGDGNLAVAQLERSLEEGQETGHLSLAAQQLKAYPRKLAANFDLSDLVALDLSKNRVTEIDVAICDFFCLQSLNVYNNLVKSIPLELTRLQFLKSLNLSRNQLTGIPDAVCRLTRLRILIVSHNKLVSIPEEIHCLSYLQQLDVASNDIDRLPDQICQLEDLRSLDVRANRLQRLPEAIGELKLVKLDVSVNRIRRLPLSLRLVKTLETFCCEHNPLQLPPARISRQGIQYVFKHLHAASARLDVSAKVKGKVRSAATSGGSPAPSAATSAKAGAAGSTSSSSFSGQSRDRDSGYGATSESIHADVMAEVWDEWEEEEEERGDGQPTTTTTGGATMTKRGKKTLLTTGSSNLRDKEEKENFLHSQSAPAKLTSTSEDNDKDDDEVNDVNVGDQRQSHPQLDQKQRQQQRSPLPDLNSQHHLPPPPSPTRQRSYRRGSSTTNGDVSAGVDSVFDFDSSFDDGQKPREALSSMCSLLEEGKTTTMTTTSSTTMTTLMTLPSRDSQLSSYMSVDESSIDGGGGGGSTSYRSSSSSSSSSRTTTQQQLRQRHPAQHPTPRDALSSMSSSDSYGFNNTSGTLTPRSNFESGRTSPTVTSPTPASEMQFQQQQQQRLRQQQQQQELLQEESVKNGFDLSPPKGLNSQMNLLDEFHSLTADLHADSFQVSPGGGGKSPKKIASKNPTPTGSPRRKINDNGNVEFKVGGDDNDEQEEIEAENRRNANHRRLHIDNGNQGDVFSDEDDEDEDEEEEYLLNHGSSSSSLSPTTPMPPLPPLLTNSSSHKNRIKQQQQQQSRECASASPPSSRQGTPLQPPARIMLTSAMSIDDDDVGDEEVIVDVGQREDEEEEEDNDVMGRKPGKFRKSGRSSGGESQGIRGKSDREADGSDGSSPGDSASPTSVTTSSVSSMSISITSVDADSDKGIGGVGNGLVGTPAGFDGVESGAGGWKSSVETENRGVGPRRGFYVGKFVDRFEERCNSPSSPLTPTRPHSRQPEVSTPSSSSTAPPRLSTSAPRDASPILHRPTDQPMERPKPSSLIVNRRSSPSSARDRHSSPSYSPSPTQEHRWSPTQEQRWSAQRRIRLCLERVLTNIQLPEDENETFSVLSDGAILCNFVNHLKPRSVPTIHVPSPQFPKLSSYKCRLNVENFVRACRQSGVDSRQLCAVDDVLDELRPVKIADTLQQLLDIHSVAVFEDEGAKAEALKGEKRAEEGTDAILRQRSTVSTLTDASKGAEGPRPVVSDVTTPEKWRDPRHSKMDSSFQDRLVSYLCLFIFLASVFLLYVYPAVSSTNA